MPSRTITADEFYATIIIFLGTVTVHDLADYSGVHLCYDIYTFRIWKISITAMILTQNLWNISINEFYFGFDAYCLF